MVIQHIWIFIFKGDMVVQWLKQQEVSGLPSTHPKILSVAYRCENVCELLYVSVFVRDWLEIQIDFLCFSQTYNIVKCHCLIKRNDDSQQRFRLPYVYSINLWNKTLLCFLFCFRNTLNVICSHIATKSFLILQHQRGEMLCDTILRMSVNSFSAFLQQICFSSSVSMYNTLDFSVQVLPSVHKLPFFITVVSWHK